MPLLSYTGIVTMYNCSYMPEQTHGKQYPSVIFVTTPGTGLGSCRRECVNAVQVSAAQGPKDTVAALLTQSRDPTDHLRPECHQNPQSCLTAMSERATLILDSVVQKYQRSTGPLHAQGDYASHQWRRLLAGLYLPVRIQKESCIIISHPVGIRSPTSMPLH